MTVNFTGEFLGIVGLSLFSISYFSFAVFFFNIGRNNEWIWITQMVGVSVVGFMDYIGYKENAYGLKLHYSQIVLHVLFLLAMLAASAELWLRLNQRRFPILFFIATILVITNNSLFALSALGFMYKNVIINVLVGLTHGLYMYFLVGGYMRMNKTMREKLDT